MTWSYTDCLSVICAATGLPTAPARRCLDALRAYYACAFYVGLDELAPDQVQQLDHLRAKHRDLLPKASDDGVPELDECAIVVFISRVAGVPVELAGRVLLSEARYSVSVGRLDAAELEHIERLSAGWVGEGAN